MSDTPKQPPSARDLWLPRQMGAGPVTVGGTLAPDEKPGARHRPFVHLDVTAVQNRPGRRDATGSTRRYMLPAAEALVVAEQLAAAAQAAIASASDLNAGELAAYLGVTDG